MPEDWDYEEGIRRACKDTADALCPSIHSGFAMLYRCLRCNLHLLAPKKMIVLSSHWPFRYV